MAVRINAEVYRPQLWEHSIALKIATVIPIIGIFTSSVVNNSLNARMNQDNLRLADTVEILNLKREYAEFDIMRHIAATVVSVVFYLDPILNTLSGVVSIYLIYRNYCEIVNITELLHQRLHQVREERLPHFP